MAENAQTLEQQIVALMRQGVEAYWNAAGGEGPLPEPVALEIPRNSDHGDWACSVALRLARPLRRKPLEIAQGIAAAMPSSPLIGPAEVAAPGFINLRLTAGALANCLRRVLEQGEAFGHSDAYCGQRAMVEFVSANPTGPLHIGHCRGAVIGDALARIFAAAGYDVCREYYYNDAGVQMHNLGESLRARYLQALGQEVPFPENGYQGEYMVELGQRLKAEQGDAQANSATPTQVFTDYAAGFILKLIDDDLATLRIHFDSWFSETTLHKDGRVAGVLDRLAEKGKLYELDGARWLRTVDFGDEKDRVVVKSDGNYTYLAPDIAYHEHKFSRGFTRLINVLGADHHGYIPRLKAAVQALGYRPEQLGVVIVQMVSVENEGEVMKLSTRRGDFITLKEVIDEIGPDVTRFLFLMRSPDSQMVFDFKLAKDTSMDNPLYYVQYAHARCCSLMRKAEEEKMPWTGSAEGVDLPLLTAPEELAIIHQMDRLQAVVLQVVAEEDPSSMTAYITELATAFHAYFSAGNRDVGLRVVQPGRPDLTQARLTLIAALRQVLANALRLLGVEPLDRL